MIRAADVIILSFMLPFQILYAVLDYTVNSNARAETSFYIK